MANYTYDPGPQLPNYMKKRAEAGAPSGTARAAKETAPRKKTSSSTARSGGGTARKVSSGVQAGRTAKPQTQKRGTNSSKTTHSAAKTTNGVVSAKKRGGTTGENKRKKAQQRKRMLHVLLVAAVGLAGIICIIWLANRDDTGNIPTDIEAIMSTKKTFRDGVKLIGVDVSGMTPEEATGLVKYAAEKKLEKVAVTVALEDAGWTFSASDLGMSYDLTEMFVDGLAYGRSDDSEVQDVLAAGAGEFDAEYTWSRETILLALAQLEPSINTEATQPYAEPITDWESEERFNYIAGAEGLFPTENFAPVFAKVREYGVPMTLHAGEAAGPDSMKTALSFGTKRIGHGVAAINDPELIKRLIDENVTLEVCVTSNYHRKVVPAINMHPIHKLLEAGVHVTVNSDNRTCSRTTLQKEKEVLKEELGFTDEEIEKMQEYAWEARFLK